MTPDVHAAVRRIEIDAVRAEFRRRRWVIGVRIDGLDHLHRLRVEHGDVRMTTGEAVRRLRVYDRAVAATVGDFADRRERFEIEHRDSAWNGLSRRSAISGGNGTQRVARDVETAVDRVRVDVVGATLTAD